PTTPCARASPRRARPSSATRSTGDARSGAWRGSFGDGGSADGGRAVFHLRQGRRPSPLGHAGSRVRGAGLLHGRPLWTMRLSLPAAARARRAPGRVLSRSLSPASRALAAAALQGLEESPARRPLGPGRRARLRGLPRRARLAVDAAQSAANAAPYPMEL